jgi:hypothetical protein
VFVERRVGVAGSVGLSVAVAVAVRVGLMGISVTVGGALPIKVGTSGPLLGCGVGGAD